MASYCFLQWKNLISCHFTGGGTCGRVVVDFDCNSELVIEGILIDSDVGRHVMSETREVAVDNYKSFS